MTFTTPSSSILDENAGILGYSLQSRFNQLATHLTEDAYEQVILIWMAGMKYLIKVIRSILICSPLSALCSSHPITPHSIPSYPNTSQHIPFHSIPSHLILSYPTLSYPTPYHPILPHIILSYPISSVPFMGYRSTLLRYYEQGKRRHQQ